MLKRNIKILKIEEDFSLLIKIFDVVGLQNFDSKDLSYENFHKTTSKCRFYFSLIRWIITSCYVTCIIFEFMKNLMNSYSNIVTDFARSIYGILLFLFIIVLSYQSISSTQKFMKTYFNLNKCLNIFQNELPIKVDLKPLKKSVYLQFFLLIFSLILYYFVQVKQLNYSFLVKILGGIPSYIFAFSTIFYLFFIQLFNFLFSLIVKTLEEQSELYNTEVKISVITLRIYHDEQVNLVKSCRKVYEILIETKKLINEAFGLTVLISIFIIVISLTLSGYRTFILYIEFKYSGLSMGE